MSIPSASTEPQEFARRMLDKGTAREEIVAMLVSNGYEKKMAELIVKQAATDGYKNISEQARFYQSDVYKGIGLIVFGVLLSMIFRVFAEIAGMQYTLLFYGPVVTGIYFIGRAIWRNLTRKADTPEEA